MANTVDKPEVAAHLDSGLLEQLGKPETIEALKLVLSKIDVLAFAVQAADEFFRRGDVITDNIGETLGELRKVSASVDFEKVRTVAAQLPALLDEGDAMIKFGTPAKLKKIADAGAIVVDSGMLKSATVALLAQAGRIVASSFIETQAAPRKDIKGVFDLLAVMKDPRIQHAMGFFVEFMKRYSEKLR